VGTSGLAGLAPLLARFLPAQRWFAGRGRALGEVRPGPPVRLNQGTPAFLHLLVDVPASGAGGARYQVPLGLDVTPPVPPAAALGTVRFEGRDLVAYDALGDERLRPVLLERMAEDAELGGLRFVSAGDRTRLRARRSRVLGGEQSNTSVVYDDRLILKLFRRVHDGVNPELELTRALARRGFAQVVPPLGWLETAGPGTEGATLAVVQPFLRGAREGFQVALERTRAWHGGDGTAGFGAQARALGTLTGELHLALAAAFGGHRAGPEELEAARRRRAADLELTLRAAPTLAPRRAGIATVRAAADLAGAHLQRVHGDYHLGQVVRVAGPGRPGEVGAAAGAGAAGPRDWYVLDLEGEPARPLAERRRPDSPFKDVAGMLRSFDYAAFHPLVSGDVPGRAGAEARALAWIRQARAAYLDAWLAAVAPGGWLPDDPAPLLRAFELDKALYEVRYEASYRPDWLPIPLGGVGRLLAGQS
jgi:maltokinase